MSPVASGIAGSGEAIAYSTNPDIDGLPRPLTAEPVTTGAAPGTIVAQPAPEEIRDYVLEGDGYPMRRTGPADRRSKANIFMASGIARAGQPTALSTDLHIDGLPVSSASRPARAGAAPGAIAGKPAPEEILDYELERDGYRVRRAGLPDRRSKASQLIERMYSRRGYDTETASALPHCPTRITLETSRGEELFGTLTLGLDSEEGLLADALYPSEMNGLRAMGRKLCEISRLAVDPQYGSKEVFASLFHLAYIYVHIIHKATDVLIEVNPRHAGFYKRMLGFRQIGQVHTCPRVNAPAVLLHLELAYMGTQIAKHAGFRNTTERSLYPYFFANCEPEHLTDAILHAA